MKKIIVKTSWKCPKCKKKNIYKSYINNGFGIATVMPETAICKCGLDRFSQEYYDLIKVKP